MRLAFPPLKATGIFFGLCFAEKKVFPEQERTLLLQRNFLPPREKGKNPLSLQCGAFSLMFISLHEQDHEKFSQRKAFLCNCTARTLTTPVHTKSFTGGTLPLLKQRCQHFASINESVQNCYFSTMVKSLSCNRALVLVQTNAAHV